MKSFKEFVKESLSPNAGFMISRDNMPQIGSSLEFIKFLKKQNISYEELRSNVNHVRPTQIDFDQDKVDRIIDKGVNDNPIIISNDNYVLDGHHRYFAALQMDEDINILQVSLTINKLLRVAYLFIEDEVGNV